MLPSLVSTVITCSEEHECELADNVLAWSGGRMGALRRSLKDSAELIFVDPVPFIDRGRPVCAVTDLLASPRSRML